MCFYFLSLAWERLDFSLPCRTQISSWFPVSTPNETSKLVLRFWGQSTGIRTWRQGKKLFGFCLHFLKQWSFIVAPMSSGHLGSTWPGLALTGRAVLFLMSPFSSWDQWASISCWWQKLKGVGGNVRGFLRPMLEIDTPFLSPIYCWSNHPYGRIQSQEAGTYPPPWVDYGKGVAAVTGK